MRIDRGRIAACLRANYGVTVASIEELGLGHDAEAAVYRVEATDGRAYFLKLRSGPPDEASIDVPRFLHERAGIDAVVAPLPTTTGAPWGVVETHSALLYPYLPGRNGFAGGLSRDQWTRLGTALRQIHAATVPPDLQAALRVERFVPAEKWIAPLRAVLAGEHRRRSRDAIAEEAAVLLAERHAEIATLLARTEALGRQVQQRPVDRVLCHADIHLGNVLVGDDGRLHLVDWDQPVLAPRECDLMLLFGTAVGGFARGSAEELAFRVGYGSVEPDPLAMAYYYHERATTDIGAFAHEIFWLRGASDDARRGAVRWLAVLFEPVRSVEAAHQAFARLPA